MGERGTVPLRSGEGLGHPKKAQGVDEPDRVSMRGEVQIPPEHPAWHSLAKMYYASIAASGQSQFYEPSDWAQLQYSMHMLSTALRMDEPNAALITALDRQFTRLLVTEGDRRRMRMEIDRTRAAEGGPLPEGVTALSDRRAALQRPKTVRQIEQ